MKKCDYIYDYRGDYPDINDCPSCIREKMNTCPLEIYDDTVIDFTNSPSDGAKEGKK